MSDMRAAGTVSVDRLTKFSGTDLDDLCEATESAITEGGGFGWLKPPPRQVLENYWKGVLLVPERRLVVGRLDGIIAGSAQLSRAPRNNEAQAFAGTLTSAFVAPWARGRGLGRGIVREIERLARELGLAVLNLDLRDTQRAAIGLYENLGYRRWGTHPVYAQVEGRILPGHYYYKLLDGRAGDAVILYPAIDLKDGACVRLLRGDMASATVFNANPAAQARAFAEAGFSWLHVVDLNGAFAGRSVNGEAVKAIRASVDLRMQLGGGIRDREAIDEWLALGIDRVVLGTAALRDPDLVRRAAADHPGAIAVGIDARNGHAAIEGWAETTGVGVVDLARRFEDCGVAAVIYTDIARDGALSGIDARAIADFARQVSIPVIASGGVSSLADIAALKAHEADGIAGVICGRALYDGRIDPQAALRLSGEPIAC